MGSVICKERVFSFASASASFAPLFCPNFNFNITMSISKHSAASVPRRNRARRTFSRKAIAVSCCVCRRPTIDARSATRIWLNLPSNLWMNSVYNYCWSANFFHKSCKTGNYMNDLNAVTSVNILISDFESFQKKKIMKCWSWDTDHEHIPTPWARVRHHTSNILDPLWFEESLIKPSRPTESWCQSLDERGILNNKGFIRNRSRRSFQLRASGNDIELYTQKTSIEWKMGNLTC